MPLTNAGGAALAALICADASVPPYNSTNARIGVGDSSTAFSAAHTDLQAATNKLRKLVTGAPIVVGNQVTFSATFGVGEAVYAFNEIGLFNHATAGTMMSRKVISLGTKPTNESWTTDLICTTAVGS